MQVIRLEVSRTVERIVAVRIQQPKLMATKAVDGTDVMEMVTIARVKVMLHHLEGSDLDRDLRIVWTLQESQKGQADAVERDTVDQSHPRQDTTTTIEAPRIVTQTATKASTTDIVIQTKTSLFRTDVAKVASLMTTLRLLLHLGSRTKKLRPLQKRKTRSTKPKKTKLPTKRRVLKVNLRMCHKTIQRLRIGSMRFLHKMISGI